MPKDTGPWEEKTFNSTASSDVAIINDAFRKVIDLMYSPTKNKELLKVRTRLLNAKNGSIFKDEQGLRNMLKIGEHRIKTNSAWEFPTQRKRDGAKGKIKFVPGTHTPLTWAQASLYDASKLFEQNLKRYPEIIKS